MTLVYLSIYLSIYLSVYVCVCVCVCENKWKSGLTETQTTDSR